MHRIIFMFVLLLLVNVTFVSKSFAEKDKVSVIVEIDGNVDEHEQYIRDYWPSVEIIATYTELFQGIALKIPPKKSKKILSEPFIQGIHPVKRYETLNTVETSHQIFTKDQLSIKKKSSNIVFPGDFNETPYTGKGIKVAVIDTGIATEHEDLMKNFKGGYDLVDLDEDPMETTFEEGIPTIHGSHVAGIIAANGIVKGVAPEAEIHAYRALGPGGMGTSIQVMAAMEEAVKDGVDIINLSLGTSVNGPDYPTSKAVNEASKRGIAVVVANGNTGPNNWTVGAPATASSAISVGAYESVRTAPFLYEPMNRKKIHLKTMPSHRNWDLQRDHQIATSLSDEEIQAKILLMNDENINVQKAIELGVKAIIAKEELVESMVMIEESLAVPIAFVNEEDFNWMAEHPSQFFQHQYEKTSPATASFSSRGPVNNSWEVKPDIIAPGVNIISTVPNGYAILSGTSMAAPHISGAIAVMKEARPSWSNEKIMNALKTTAMKIGNTSILGQGAGLARIEEALNTETIIGNSLMTIGKTEERLEQKSVQILIENTTNKEQTYLFKHPENTRGIQWDLPLTFTVQPKQKKSLPIHVTVNEQLLKEPMIQGQLILQQKNNTYELPYFIITKETKNPIIAGFSLHRDKWDEEIYNYELYITEQVKSIKIQLYEQDTMLNEGVLWESTEISEGINKGEIPREDIKQRGQFNAIIIAQLENGEFVNEQTTIYIE